MTRKEEKEEKMGRRKDEGKNEKKEAGKSGSSWKKRR